MATIGILMLETRFPRLPGDIGNPDTWPFPVLYRTVQGATPGRVVRPEDPDLLPDFIEAAQSLEAQGAQGITTSCGFLSLYNDALAAAVSVPVAASALSQVALANRLLPASRRAGILTVSASALGAAHLAAAGVPDDTPVGSTEGGRVFSEAILGDAEAFDRDAAEADNVDAAWDLLARHPEVGAIVLECTNMAPYAGAIRRATGVPVYSIVSFVEWFHAGLTPRH